MFVVCWNNLIKKQFLINGINTNFTPPSQASCNLLFLGNMNSSRIILHKFVLLKCVKIERLKSTRTVYFQQMIFLDKTVYLYATLYTTKSCRRLVRFWTCRPRSGYRDSPQQFNSDRISTRLFSINFISVQSWKPWMGDKANWFFSWSFHHHAFYSVKFRIT